MSPVDAVGTFLICAALICAGWCFIALILELLRGRKNHRPAAVPAAAPPVEGPWARAHTQLQSALSQLRDLPTRSATPSTLRAAIRQVLEAVPADSRPAPAITNAATVVAQKIVTTLAVLRDGTGEDLEGFSDPQGRTVSDAADEVFAALTKDLNRIGAEATNVTGRITRLTQLAQPGDSAVRDLDTWSLAVQELSRRGHAGDSATITALRGHINELSALDQTTVQHALTAISDASKTLAKIPEDQRDQPNGDGTTPNSDAAAVIALATEAITAAAQAAVDGDIDQLRILRRYAQQWDRDPALDLPEVATPAGGSDD